MNASWKKVLLVPTVSLLAVSSIFLPSRIGHLMALAGHAHANVPAQQPASAQASAPAPAQQNIRPILAVDNYLKRLIDRGCPGDSQALLIQTLDGRILAEHNADTPLNPASVMKLSTSYLALKHFGPEYRFKTVAYTFGKIEEAHQTLYGDLIIDAEGDPNFTAADARSLGDAIRAQGIRHIEGTLIVNGPFRLRHMMDTEFAYAKLRALLGISFPKKNAPVNAPVAPAANAAPANGERVLLATHYAAPLKELLLYMNAHSDNFYAEEIGFALGGPNVVQEELATEFHLRPDALYISHTSGLDYNRITPRASVAVLQKMIDLLKSHQMHIEDIMPVAGVDSGTLITRLRQPGVCGGVVAKTGTLNSTDNGVSTLEGVIYSEQYGPMLFAIFNMGGGVHYFRHEQDQFLSEALNELGTSVQTVRNENILQQPEEELLADNSASMHMHAKHSGMRGGHSHHQYHAVMRHHRR